MDAFAGTCEELTLAGTEWRARKIGRTWRNGWERTLFQPRHGRCLAHTAETTLGSMD